MRALTGYEPGEGPFYGRMTIQPGAAADEFTTEVSYTYARSGRSVARTGRSVIYTGHQWRGRTTVGGDDATSLREVMFVERDWQSIAGRWFSGGYDELGLDVQLTRLGRDPVLTGLDRAAVARGSSAQAVRVFGESLPAAIVAGDIDFGPGISVSRVTGATPTAITVEINVAPDAAVGLRDLFVAGARCRLASMKRWTTLAVGPRGSGARGLIFRRCSRFEPPVRQRPRRKPGRDD
jgi:quinohemoprotein amine dehydrogenase